MSYPPVAQTLNVTPDCLCALIAYVLVTVVESPEFVCVAINVIVVVLTLFC